MQRLAFIIVLLIALPHLLGIRGGGRRGPVGPPRSQSEYTAAAQRLFNALDSDDTAQYEALFARGTRRRGGRQAARLASQRADMVQALGAFSMVSRVDASPGFGTAVINAERGGWLATMKLDGQGQFTSLQLDPL